MVGSVHFLRDESLDMEEYSVWSTTRSAEEIWRRYFQTLGEAARSGLFDILAHPDLVKVWGPDRPRPEGDLRRYYELAIEGIAESGIAVEVSTAGLRKRAREIYPAPAFLEMCVEAGAPVALSSDAHRPQDVGADYEQALELLERVGVRELCRVRAPRPAPGADRRGRAMSLSGIGYDCHRFAAGRRLVLGGVEIPHERGLEGHSDADVLTHAVIDALLGAAGLGDIGEHFPDTDARYRDADSLELLETVLTSVIAAGFEVENVDCTVIMEAPSSVRTARRSASVSPWR